jgi:hypothetical protein
MSTQSIFTRLSVLVALASLVASATAQWSNDPNQNLGIAVVTEGQSQAKVAPTKDGGSYVSWYDPRESGYAVYLQRLDSRGYPQWAANGIVVAATTLSSTTDYGLAVDPNGDALLAYQDNRPGTTQIGANKVAPDGTLLWGAGGVILTNQTEGVYSPKVAVTSDGYYVVAWTQGTDVVLQKLDGDGVPQWSPAVREIRPGTTGTYSFDTVRDGGNGAVIVSWVYRIGTLYSNKYIYAQKYGGDGSPLWNGGSPLPVYNGGSVQNGYFPSFLSDGQGGAVFGWYEVTTGSRKAWVQHLDPNGVELFAHNGVAASTSALLHLTPSVAYDPNAGDIYLFWTMTNSAQSQWGLYGQRFSASGARQWTDNALVLIPLSANQTANVQAVCVGHSAEVFCSDRSGSALLLGFRLDTSGNQLWPSQPLTACGILSSKSRLAVATTVSGMAILAWSDGRADFGDIYAQNVNPAGTLGFPAFILGDLDCNGWVDFADINPFVLAISDPAAYGGAYPNCNFLHGDCNSDGFVDFDDINPFIVILSDGLSD